MGKIQRYFVSLSVNQEIPDDENGHWVKYSDYQKELAAMTADRDRWKALSNDTPVKMVLDDYTQWLSDFGYLDEDVFSEIPKAVDRYLEDRKTRPVPPVQPVFLRGMVEDLKRDCPACGGVQDLR